MPITVHDVAKLILEDEGKPMTTMKLQKLCYYSQAWHLAWYGTPLFDEDFQAWANGPVCYELFKQHQGKYSVSANDLRVGSSAAVGEQATHVRAIKAHYGELTGTELSALTHSELPWRESRGKSVPGASSSTPIPKASLQTYYSALVAG